MRRSLWIRILTATWGLWLGVALSEPMMLHSCAVTGARATGMAGMASMARGAQSDASHHPAPAHSSTECFGACCCAPSVLAPSGTAAEISARVTVGFGNVSVSSGIDVPVTATHYSQPFANGPPAKQSI